jgi:hypothetical protein
MLGLLATVVGIVWVTRPERGELTAVSTKPGRKALANTLVMYHGQAVTNLLNGPNTAWANPSQEADWLEQHGQWIGEIVTTMRERGCPASDVHDLGVLGPPRHLKGYRTTSLHDHRMDMLQERLGRIKEMIKKYEA